LMKKWSIGASAAADPAAVTLCNSRDIDYLRFARIKGPAGREAEFVCIASTKLITCLSLGGRNRAARAFKHSDRLAFKLSILYGL
jgi:hypothetical protein